MTSALYQDILARARDVDTWFAGIGDAELARFRVSFPVPASHPRASVIREYAYACAPVRDAFSGVRALVLVDDALRAADWLPAEFPANADVHWMVPIETETKECGRLDAFYDAHVVGREYGEIVAVGGGIVINAASYLAEKAGCGLAYVPTTVLAMADAAIGGKVRANRIVDGECRKHAYKSWYEPDRVIVEPRFLDTVPDRQISVGMGEIIKQGVYQSRPLLDWLASDAFDPFRDRKALLRAVLWAAALAANCLTVDPDESKEGSHIVMRGAHDASDKIEEASGFTVPHGIAVAQAIRQELADAGSPLLPLVERCMRKFRM